MRNRYGPQMGLIPQIVKYTDVKTATMEQLGLHLPVL